MKQLNWYQIFGNTHTVPEGSTVTPTDDVQILLHCANIWDKSYTTIGEVIADDDTLFLTLIDNNAIDYLVRSTTFVSSIVASESAMQYIGASDYASETLLSDSTWLTAIDGSAYKDYVINAKVPTMTSDTTPSGVASASSITDSSHPAYYAFDGNDSTTWQSANGLSQTIQYRFVQSAKLCKCVILSGPAVNYLKEYDIQGSNDGSDWDVIGSYTNSSSSTSDFSHLINSTAKYLYFRLNIRDTYQLTASSKYGRIKTLQFYGRENAGVQSWLKAGGITNKKYTTVSEVLSDLTTLATLMSSTDAIDYLVTAKGWATEICSDSNAMADIGMNNYAANTLLADSVWCDAIVNSTYSSSVLNVSVPTMTDNTHPYGECFVSMPGATEPAWKAFDGDDSSVAVVADVSGEGYIGYEFVSAVKIVGCYVDARANSRLQTYKIQGSNDGTTWNDISEVIALPSSKYGTGAFANTTTYKHIRLYQVTKTLNNVGYYTIQFYGRKDI